MVYSHRFLCLNKRTYISVLQKLTPPPHPNSVVVNQTKHYKPKSVCVPVRDGIPWYTLTFITRRYAQIVGNT